VDPRLALIEDDLTSLVAMPRSLSSKALKQLAIQVAKELRGP
jgi:hypothetical protein